MSKKITKQQLLNKINILESSMLSNLQFSKTHLDKLTEQHYMASGLHVEIKDLSGNVKAKFVVADGFKYETILELKKELDKSIKLQTILVKD